MFDKFTGFIAGTVLVLSLTFGSGGPIHTDPIHPESVHPSQVHPSVSPLGRKPD